MYKQIVYWVQKGKTYTEIADRLMKSPSTIRNAIVSDTYLRVRYEQERFLDQLKKEQQKKQLKLF